MICLKARAKVNLFLEIGEPRKDGFHELETVFQNIDLADELRFEKGEGFQIRSDDPDLPTDRRNLIWKAAEKLAERTGVRQGFSVQLTKRIPSGAGLGGGSADAAATLLALNELWETHLSPGEIAEIAAGIGSDVPFFLEGGTALGKGRGEILEALPTPELSLVVALPEARISTPWAYGKLDEKADRQHYSIEPMLDALKRGNPEMLAMALANGFEEALFPQLQALADLKIQFLILGAMGAALSGSGSALFGIFWNQASAERAAEALTQKGFTAFATQTEKKAIVPC